MTWDEATKIGAIVGTADNGCSVCVDSLITRLNETFPQFIWTRGAMIDGDEENDYQTAYTVDVSEH